MKKLILTSVIVGLLAILFAACGSGSGSGYGSSSNSTGSGSTTDVHLGTSNFVQNSVSISKGSSINFVDDVGVVHIINNGSWVGNTPEPATQSGAPTITHTFNGNDSFTLGPFNTSGTFHYYCSVHPGMNLTVTVQ